MSAVFLKRQIRVQFGVWRQRGKKIHRPSCQFPHAEIVGTLHFDDLLFVDILIWPKNLFCLILWNTLFVRQFEKSHKTRSKQKVESLLFLTSPEAQKKRKRTYGKRGGGRKCSVGSVATRVHYYSRECGKEEVFRGNLREN